MFLKRGAAGLLLTAGLQLGSPAAFANSAAGELKPWKARATPALLLQDAQGREHRLATFVIAPRGRIAYSLVSEADWSSPAMVKMLRALQAAKGK